ncbi:MAG: hypothetical protein ACYC8T_15985, partial [Myxococcaceae bacterium]
AVAATGAAVSVRLSVDVESRRAEDRRVQALWLARSAASLSRPGTTSVALGRDLAQVTTVVTPGVDGNRVISTVLVEGHGTASVEAVFGRAGAPVVWRERYDR